MGSHILKTRPPEAAVYQIFIFFLPPLLDLLLKTVFTQKSRL